ncbi:hypothetical protein BDR26DRAFT_954415 [Obelidium mucronatum]|nr:hypothetical protein BDR26DRAFT_954415 [Obelidium mucronatum]
MGTGKTEVIAEYLRHAREGEPNARVVAITGYTCLARALATRLGLAFYKDMEGGQMRGQNLSIVLDSLTTTKTGGNTWDIIILNKTGLLHQHTTTSTFMPWLVASLSRLKSVLLDAQRVVLAQHDLCQLDLDYFMAFTGEDPHGVNVKMYDCVVPDADAVNPLRVGVLDSTHVGN